MNSLKYTYIIIALIFSGCFEGGTKYNLQSTTTEDQNDGANSPSQTRESNSPSSPDLPRELPENTPTPPQSPSDSSCGKPVYDIEELLQRIELLERKKEDWEEIIVEGLENFKIIEPIFKNKCYACHDSDRGLPWYGKPFKERNSVYHHYIDGIAALDFSTKFPLTSKGTNNQVALLNGIKNAVLDETMPLKVYTRFYPRRKITPQDKMAVKYWVEPLVEKIEAWEQKYIYNLEDKPLFTIKECDENPTPMPQIDLQASRRKVDRVFSAKCFRCHANGVSKGGFGDMHDLEKLKSSTFVNLREPDLSDLYLISQSGEMPPSARDRLTNEEVQIILEWINAEADTIQ